MLARYKSREAHRNSNRQKISALMAVEGLAGGVPPRGIEIAMCNAEGLYSAVPFEGG